MTVGSIQVRDYQQQLIDGTRNAMRTNKRVLLQAETGAGKTRTSAAIVASAVAKGSVVLFVVSGRQLVTQALASYEALGIDAAPLMAGFVQRQKAPVQIASVHTLCSRMDTLDWLEPNLIISDEAHEGASGDTGMWAQIRARWPRAYELGLSATPRPTKAYSALVPGPGYEYLIRQGYLVQPRFYSVPESEADKLKVANGDYTENSQAEAFGKLTLVGGIVGHYKRFAQGRPTVVFGPNVGTSMRNAELFNEAGIPAFHLDANTPHDDRQAAFKALEDGSLKVLCNYQVLSRGFDSPCISCVILERETKSLRTFIQMIGRGLRAYPEKQDCIVLDLGLNIHRHGDFVSNPPDWTLDGSRETEKEEAEVREANARKDITCSACAFVYPAGPRCTSCGHKPEPKAPEAKDDARIDAELTEIKPGKKREPTRDEKQDYYCQLKHVQRERGYKPGWVGNTYKAKFGVYPRGLDYDAPPLPPTGDVLGFVKHSLIRHAKARKPQPQPSAHD